MKTLVLSGSIPACQGNANIAGAAVTTGAAGAMWNSAALMAMKQQTGGDAGLRSGSLHISAPAFSATIS